MSVCACMKRGCLPDTAASICCTRNTLMLLAVGKSSFPLKTSCLTELFMKHETNVPIPTAVRSSCGTVQVPFHSRCCSSRQTPGLLQDVCAGAVRVELCSTLHLQCCVVMKENPFPAQNIAQNRQNVKPGNFRYFRRTPEHTYPACRKMSPLCTCKLTQAIYLY